MCCSCRRGTVEAGEPDVSNVLILKGARHNESLAFLKNQTEEKHYVYRTSRTGKENQKEPHKQQHQRKSGPSIWGCIRGACQVAFNIVVVILGGFFFMAFTGATNDLLREGWCCSGLQTTPNQGRLCLHSVAHIN